MAIYLWIWIAIFIAGCVVMIGPWPRGTLAILEIQVFTMSLLMLAERAALVFVWLGARASRRLAILCDAPRLHWLVMSLLTVYLLVALFEQTHRTLLNLDFIFNSPPHALRLTLLWVQELSGIFAVLAGLRLAILMNRQLGLPVHLSTQRWIATTVIIVIALDLTVLSLAQVRVGLQPPGRNTASEGLLEVVFSYSSSWSFRALLGWLCVLVFLVRRRLRRANRCMACGYNLTANESGICPECGKATEERLSRG